MADATLSITVRDENRPCAPYQTTGRSFFLQVFHCDRTPLVWKGVNYGGFNVPMEEPGAAGGRIHAQIEVPAGCYLVRAGGQGCGNVPTDWAWVNVGCGETECVDLMLPSVRHCTDRMIIGLLAGAVGERPVRELIPQEAERAIEVLREIADRLPRDPLPPPPTEEDLQAIG
jgi:hypothetical protein